MEALRKRNAFGIVLKKAGCGKIVLILKLVEDDRITYLCLESTNGSLKWSIIIS